MIIGFGSTEIETSLKIIRECLDNLDLVDSIKERLNKESDAYKAMDKNEAPERYTTFWCRKDVIHEHMTIVEFHMFHVNRRHAMSPDGWACLQTRWIAVIDDDGAAIFKQEA